MAKARFQIFANYDFVAGSHFYFTILNTIPERSSFFIRYRSRSNGRGCRFRDQRICSIAFENNQPRLLMIHMGGSKIRRTPSHSKKGKQNCLTHFRGEKKNRLAGAKRRPAGASRAAGDFFKKGARFFTF